MANLSIQWAPRVVHKDNRKMPRIEYDGTELHRESWVLIESVELEPRIQAPLQSVLYLGRGLFHTWGCYLLELIRYPGVYPVLLYIPPRQNVLCFIDHFPLLVGPPWVKEEFEQQAPNLILRYSLTEAPPEYLPPFADS